MKYTMGHNWHPYEISPRVTTTGIQHPYDILWHVGLGSFSFGLSMGHNIHAVITLAIWI